MLIRGSVSCWRARTLTSRLMRSRSVTSRHMPSICTTAPSSTMTVTNASNQRSSRSDRPGKRYSRRHGSRVCRLLAMAARTPVASCGPTSGGAIVPPLMLALGVLLVLPSRRSCPRDGRGNHRAWSTTSADGSAGPTTRRRSVPHRRRVETVPERTSQAALLREHDCRWFQACLVSQALSHPRRDDLDLGPAEPRAQLSFRDWPNSCPQFVRVKRRFYSQLVTRVPPRCSGPTTKAHLACLVRGRGRLVQIASP